MCSEILGHLFPLDDKLEKYLREGELLGVGHNGAVYLLKDGTALKVFVKKKVCDDEFYILHKAKGSKYFPKVYKRGSNYIIRECVYGTRLDKYLNKKPLTDDISKNLIKLILDFKRLNFSKLDIRLKDIYIQPDSTLKIIDPKRNYKDTMPYPRHLMKGLHKRGYLEDFLACAKIEVPKYEPFWRERFYIYICTEVK